MHFEILFMSSSHMATQSATLKHVVNLKPAFTIPSHWRACLGVVHDCDAAFFRGGQDLPLQDDITYRGNERKILRYQSPVVTELKNFASQGGNFGANWFLQ
uniref:Uncharacterized protein n=1 Tax=Physcomitrium patens TaxID=3218 RepID=A0A7I4FUN2_PHYPA